MRPVCGGWKREVEPQLTSRWMAGAKPGLGRSLGSERMETQDASQSGRSRVLPARIRLCLGRFTAGDGRKMGQLFLRLGERRDRYVPGRGKILRAQSELLRPGDDPGRSLSRQVVFDPAVAGPYLPCRARIG